MLIIPYFPINVFVLSISRYATPHPLGSATTVNFTHGIQGHPQQKRWVFFLFIHFRLITVTLLPDSTSRDTDLSFSFNDAL